MSVNINTNNWRKWLLENYETTYLSRNHLAKLFNITLGVLAKFTSENKLYHSRKYKFNDTKGFALYKGENIICYGTIPEIAKHQNISEDTVKFYMKPAYIERRKNSKNGNYRLLICLDD